MFPERLSNHQRRLDARINPRGKLGPAWPRQIAAPQTISTGKGKTRQRSQPTPDRATCTVEIFLPRGAIPYPPPAREWLTNFYL